MCQFIIAVNVILRGMAGTCASSFTRHQRHITAFVIFYQQKKFCEHFSYCGNILLSGDGHWFNDKGRWLFWYFWIFLIIFYAKFHQNQPHQKISIILSSSPETRLKTTQQQQINLYSSSELDIKLSVANSIWQWKILNGMFASE